jgi:hypothetical protein
MLLAILAKLSYGFAVSTLFHFDRVLTTVWITSLPDLVLAILFAVAYFKTPVIDNDWMTISRQATT